MFEAGGAEGGVDFLARVPVEELGGFQLGASAAGGVDDVLMFGRVERREDRGDGAEGRETEDQGAFLHEDERDQQERPTVAPEDHERVPGRLGAEAAVAVLERVAGEPGGAGHVEQRAAVVGLGRQLDRRFEGRVVVGDRQRGLVDVDLFDLPAQQDDPGGLRPRDAPHQEGPAVLPEQAFLATVRQPRHGQGDTPEQEGEDEEFGLPHGYHRGLPRVPFKVYLKAGTHKGDKEPWILRRPGCPALTLTVGSGSTDGS